MVLCETTEMHLLYRHECLTGKEDLLKNPYETMSRTLVAYFLSDIIFGFFKVVSKFHFSCILAYTLYHK